MQRRNMDVERSRETETESFGNGMFEENRRSDKKRSHQEHGHSQETEPKILHRYYSIFGLNCRKDIVEKIQQSHFNHLSYFGRVTRMSNNRYPKIALNGYVREQRSQWKA